MRSSGSPRIAWFSASTRTIVNFLYASTRRLGVDHVPILGDRGIVELEDEPGIDDRLVLLAHRIGAGEDELLLGLVIGLPMREALPGATAVMKPSSTRGRKRGLEVGDVGRDRGMADVSDRSDADRPAWPWPRGDPRIGIAIGRGEARAVATVGEGRQHRIARRRTMDRHGVAIDILDREAAEARERIAPPGAVVDLGAHRLAVLAVARHGDAGGDLAAHDVAHRRGERLLERGLVDLAGLALMVGVDESVGARQAAGVAGEDAVAAPSHVSVP